jgi:hypothetical protein
VLGIASRNGAMHNLHAELRSFTVREYDIRDLARAMVAARRWQEAAPELRDYHTNRLSALWQAFGLGEPGTDELSGMGTAAMADLLDLTVAELARSHSPFTGFLEAPPEVSDLFERHAAAIGLADRGLRHALTLLLVDLIIEVHMVSPGQTVTDDRLRSYGFDPDAPEPDPLDFW